MYPRLSVKLKGFNLRCEQERLPDMVLKMLMLAAYTADQVRVVSDNGRQPTVARLCPLRTQGYRCSSTAWYDGSKSWSYIGSYGKVPANSKAGKLAAGQMDHVSSCLLPYSP